MSGALPVQHSELLLPGYLVVRRKTWWLARGGLGRAGLQAVSQVITIDLTGDRMIGRARMWMSSMMKMKIRKRMMKRKMTLCSV